jgi:hypothetical protein
MRNSSLLSKVQHFFPFVILFVLTSLPFIPQIFCASVIAFRDMTGIFIPFELAVRSVISVDGWLAPWNPYGGVGKPLIADPFAFMLYPPHIFSRLIVPPYNFHIMLVFHHSMAALGAYLLTRTLGLSKSCAIVSAVTFTSGGYLLSCDNMTNTLYSASWFPFFIQAAILIQRAPSYSRGVSLSWFLVLSFLGGMPEVVLMEVAAIPLLVLEGFVIQRQAVRVKSMLVLGIGILLSGLLLSPILYLLLQYASESGRHPQMPQSQFASSLFDFLGFAIPAQILSLDGNFLLGGRWWKSVFSEYPLIISLYCGPLVFPMVLLLRSPRAVYWSGVAVLIFLLSLGDSGLLLPVARYLFPLLGYFRYPEKLLLGVHLLVSIACGFVLVSAWDKWWSIIACVGLLSLFFVARDLWLCLFIFGCVSLVIATHGSARIKLVSSMQIAILLAIHAYSYPTIAWSDLIRQPQISKSISGARVYVNEPREGFPSNEVAQALWRKNHLYQAWSGVFGVQNINTPSSLNLRAHDAIQEAIAESRKEKVGDLFRSLGISYVVSSSKLSGYESLVPVSGDRIQGYVYSVNGANDGIYFRTVDAGEGVKSSCTVESVRYSGPSAWEGSVSCGKSAVMVRAETAYPGWKVVVDAADKSLVSVPYKLLGVSLEPGNHLVRFSFGLDGWMIFVALFTVCVLLQCLFFGWFFWNRMLSQKNSQ